MPNFTKLESLSEGETVKTLRLSPTSLNLCLALLEDYAHGRWWFADDTEPPRKLTGDELDRADNYQAMAIVELLTEVQMFPIGSMMGWPTDNPPNGWLVCNGASVQISTYPVLAALLGTTYGETVEGFFQLPDLEGRTLQGEDGIADEVAGDVVGTRLQTAVPSHHHNTYYKRLAATGSAANTVSGNDGTAIATSDTGTVGGVDNRGPRLVANWIIKADE